MADTGFVLAGTAVDDASDGTRTWLNPGNVVASDDSRATVDFTAGAQRSHYLKSTQFGFSVPAGASIDGIQCRWELSRDNTNRTIIVSHCYTVQGGVIGGDDLGDLGIVGTTDANRDYGGPSALWNRSWTAGDINAADFGSALQLSSSVIGGSGTTLGRCDAAWIKVFYTDAIHLPPPLSLPPTMFMADGMVGH